jgi:hypothetical protein
MTHSSEIGFVASALVLIAFGMKNMINLRTVAIFSNFAFIAYALVLDLPPVLVLHVILLPLNGWRLAQAVQERRRAHKISERTRRAQIPVAPAAPLLSLSAVSFIGGFRTPAAEYAARSLKRPASETLHNSGMKADIA